MAMLNNQRVNQMNSSHVPPVSSDCFMVTIASWDGNPGHHQPNMVNIIQTGHRTATEKP